MSTTPNKKDMSESGQTPLMLLVYVLVIVILVVLVLRIV